MMQVALSVLLFHSCFRVSFQEPALDASRFDLVAKLFASHRLTRRQALTQSGSGIAAGALAALHLAADTHAQGTPQATPVQGSQRDAPEMLFVQAFRSGGITPAEGAQGRYTLTLEQGLGYTVYFSDRPDRIVGANPTPQFLQGLGFPDDNPPNAALVVETEDGQTEIAVVELFSPVYDEATHTATYEVAVLAEWERAGDMTFVESTADLAEMLPRFGAAHLFIDDCPDAEIWCSRDGVNVGSFGVRGHCYSWSEIACLPCDPWWEYVRDAMWYWPQYCDNAFPHECNGNCVPHGVCSSNESYCANYE